MKLYDPVTVFTNNIFEIYDMSTDKEQYEFIKSEPCPFPIPASVRAAFPLDCYGNKMSAIISSDVFDTQEGYVEILHEFVHCAQGMQCEVELKDQLNITQEYRKKNNYMWELTHDFPLIEKVNPSNINDMRGLFYEMRKQLFYSEVVGEE